MSFEELRHLLAVRLIMDDCKLAKVYPAFCNLDLYLVSAVPSEERGWRIEMMMDLMELKNCFGYLYRRGKC